jgi:hypothetical protein
MASFPTELAQLVEEERERLQAFRQLKPDILRKDRRRLAELRALREKIAEAERRYPRLRRDWNIWPRPEEKADPEVQETQKAHPAVDLGLRDANGFSFAAFGARLWLDAAERQLTEHLPNHRLPPSHPLSIPAMEQRALERIVDLCVKHGFNEEKTLVEIDRASHELEVRVSERLRDRLKRRLRDKTR